jgi:hypothetical protein
VSELISSRHDFRSRHSNRLAKDSIGNADMNTLSLFARQMKALAEAGGHKTKTAQSNFKKT